MLNTKCVRNAQTQHGDAGVDVENIFLHRSMLATNSGSTTLLTDAPSQPASPQCVWFHDFRGTEPADEGDTQDSGQVSKILFKFHYLNNKAFLF